jgi:hypothetical protein
MKPEKANGMGWHYPMTDFLAWINGTTWAYEREKFDVFAAYGGPIVVPARARSRLVP